MKTVCLTSVLTSATADHTPGIKRLSDDEADVLVRSGKAVYIPKKAWKTKVRPQEKEAEKLLEPVTPAISEPKPETIKKGKKLRKPNNPEAKARYLANKEARR